MSNSHSAQNWPSYYIQKKLLVKKQNKNMMLIEIHGNDQKFYFILFFFFAWDTRMNKTLYKPRLIKGNTKKTIKKIKT